MKPKSPIVIPITTPLAEFIHHLEDPDNHRIFFNGKFGTGKTHFLNEFFNETNDFKAIHLCPVNYQVSSNEDIFELIKYDILLELVERGWFEDKDELTKSLAVQSYILSEGGKTALKLLKCITKIGKVVEAGEYLTKFISGFQEYESELNKGEIDYIIEYVKDLPNKTGSAIEYDRISQIIRTVVETNRSEKLCLIIDDLDRIDPEHIFRILNVFSAHFDLHKDHENKFGFAKVIVVGDIDNIRNIYKAKYGMDADFNGYVDKFYSKAVFNFDNIKDVSIAVKKIVRAYIYNNNINVERFTSLLNYIITPILIDLVLCKSINIRDLKKLSVLKYTWEKVFTVNLSDENGFNLSSFDAPFIVDFIHCAFGEDNASTIEKFLIGQKLSNGIKGIEHIFAEVLAFNLRHVVKEKENKMQQKLEIVEFGCVLNYELHPQYSSKVVKVQFESGDSGKMTSSKLYGFLIDIQNYVNYWKQMNKIER